MPVITVTLHVSRRKGLWCPSTYHLRFDWTWLDLIRQYASNLMCNVTDFRLQIIWNIGCIYLSVCLPVCLAVSVYLSIYLSMALQSFLLHLGRFFSFLILYTVGRNPWTGDQPVGRPRPTHRIKAHRHSCLKWDSNPRSQCLSERRQI
jgi:hypothetical protein